MTSRELRNQRRAAERKAKKLEYRQNRMAAPSRAAAPEVIFAPNPDLLDEFSPEDQTEMMALRARVHARAGLRSDPPDEPAILSEAKSQERPGPTGPRSAHGKATSSGNSLKHGLASGRVIVPGEDPAEFEALLEDLLAEHSPATTTEQLLVKEMAQSYWLMQRAIHLQNQAFTETRVDVPKLALFMRYRTTHERAFYKALNTLIKLQTQRRKSDPEFVSQSRRSTRRPSGFVSQKAPFTAVSSSSLVYAETPDAAKRPEMASGA